METRIVRPSALPVVLSVLLSAGAGGCARTYWSSVSGDGSVSPSDGTVDRDSAGPDSLQLRDVDHPCDDGDPCTHSDQYVGATCQGIPYSCDDGDPCTDDTCNGDGTCALTPLTECTIGYCIHQAHPWASISSSSNRIKLSRIVRRANGSLYFDLISDMGSYKDSPQYWDVWYNYTNPPPKCYDSYAAHVGTVFEGLNEGVFPATSAGALVQKLTDTLSSPYSFHWPSNSQGGNLCASGNWWTEIKFTAAGISHVASLLQNL